jgi:mono/diheme cytochrome c family protein
MKKFFLLLPIFAVVALAQDSQGDAKKGQQYWNQYTCYGCHGFSGQNGPGLRLVPMKMPAQQLINMVRNPSQPNRMPPYSAKVLTDAQITDIWAYLKTLPDSPAAKDIPLLQDIKKQ